MSAAGTPILTASTAAAAIRVFSDLMRFPQAAGARGASGNWEASIFTISKSPDIK
jgi:hypothetical protein